MTGVLSAALLAVAAAGPAGAEVGFLGPGLATDRLDVESGMAWEAAERLTAATAILPGAAGRFVDRRGHEVSLDRFRVVWCHESEWNQSKGPLLEPLTIEALRRFVTSGRGLLLSGGAVALVGPLGIDTLRARPVPTEQDCAQAGLVPLVPRHPAFRGLDLDQGVLWMSNAVFPAFAEFQLLSRPAKGLILARPPGSRDCPLVEYEVGRGRAVVLGWRLDPLYGHAPAGYRRNFEALSANLVRYLGDGRAWQPLTRQADGRPPEVAAEPRVPDAEWRSLELAIRDLIETFREEYPRGEEFLGRLEALKRRHDAVVAGDRGGLPLTPGPSPRSTGARGGSSAGPLPGLPPGPHASPHAGPLPVAEAAELVRQFQALKTDALLANPLLDFPRLLVVKRGEKNLGLPANYFGNSSLPPTGYDNEIAVLSPIRPEGKRTTLFRPTGGEFVGDVRLAYDARRLMFSMPNAAGRWRIFEMGADGSGARALPLINEPDVDNYDACYLPDGRIVFSSTACFAGIPCVNGIGHVANLYLLETDGRIRQLTVEQDHDWCPTVLNNGRVLYLRWEYTDLPHAFSRILFHMNPDGTEQMEYYGSNSYWPAAMFFARPIPNHPTKVVAIVGGHHESPRMGAMVIFDPARGRYEAEGAVQRIPGHGRKVEPVVLDHPIGQSWPKFLHPYPLSDKHFLVACQPSEKALWGIYLVDTFDNAVLLHEEPGYAMLEPMPLRPTPKPPCVPDKVDLRRKDADVLIADIYMGDGLKGVPRGTIKSLRLVGYHFAYQEMGAEPYAVGLDGPWDPKCILGTVPVLEDGSARFRVPAYTPISLQPLDAEGKAVQLMRSWFTAMPGEAVSCVGCHEKQNTTPPLRQALAARGPASVIKPWYGPARGFAFRREVQPVLDRHCTRCHDGQPRADGPAICNLADGPIGPVRDNPNRHNQSARFTASYYHLRRLVRTPCKESDMHLLRPWEHHADTTRLVQMLRKGHYDVRLDAEGWDRLITWIDLNAPFHGNWSDLRAHEIGELVRNQAERRARMRKLYTGIDETPEDLLLGPVGKARSSGPAVVKNAVPILPADAVEGKPRMKLASLPSRAPSSPPVSKSGGQGEVASLSIPLAAGVALEMVRIPPGEFSMGQEDGLPDERPVGRVKIEKAFWMGRCEVTNEQFAQFDPGHDSRWENNDFIKFGPGELGWTLARPKQPVVRVPWTRAMAFCRWLSQKTGRSFTLPTEAQWEYACRAGTATPFWYGAADSDFSRAANLSDLSHQTVETFDYAGRPDVIPPWRPADTRFDDHSRVSAPVGSYEPNPWGLCDMHGNVAEWTRSEYRPYPFREAGKEAPGAKRVVRGGSWYDPPERCRAAFRQVYLADQPVYDVGFRVICEE